MQVTNMADETVLDVTNTSISLDSDRIALTATSKLTVASDTVAINGNAASLDISTTSITMKGATFGAGSASLTLAADTELELDADTATMTTDAMSVKGKVDVQGESSVTVNTSAFSIRNADDTERVR